VQIPWRLQRALTVDAGRTPPWRRHLLFGESRAGDRSGRPAARHPARDREAIGRRLAADRGLTLIPPYDHPHIIAGQGTAARELIEEVGPLDLLFAPCGGGGLLSGSAVSASALAPACKVIGVEP